MTHIRGWFVSFVSMAAGCLVTACGGGGGGGPQVPAVVPNGSGNVTIQMAGTWEIHNSTVVDTNDPTAAAPANGTPIVIGTQGLVSLGGLSVAQGDLEALLGFPLDVYVNQADGRKVLYAIGFDRRAQGGIRQQVGLAAGSVDDNTMAVEQFVSNQTATQQSEVYTRSRYTLTRVSSQLTLPFRTAKAPGSVDSLEGALPPVFGRQDR